MTASFSAALPSISLGASLGGAASFAASAGASFGDPGEPSNYGLAMRFTVRLLGSDPVPDLGEWTTCTGLGVTFKHETYEEGGQYEHPQQLPGRMEYPDVTLERPITNASWKLVMAWLKDVRDNWVYGDAFSYASKRPGVVIALYGVATSDPGTIVQVAHWKLANALPVSWSGPTLAADSNKVATEKLVLRHEGFLDDTDMS